MMTSFLDRVGVSMSDVKERKRATDASIWFVLPIKIHMNESQMYVTRKSTHISFSSFALPLRKSTSCVRVRINGMMDIVSQK